MRRIEIYDTTLRDGSQAEGIAFSLFDKLLFAQRLDEFGIDFIEGGYPASNDKDAQFFERVKEQPLKHAVMTAFGMTCRKDKAASEDESLRAIVAAGTSCLTIVGKSSLFQVEEIIRTTRAENLRMVADTLDFIRGNGLRVIFDAEHFFDGYRYDADYSLEVLRTAAEHGAETLVLCDTNGGSLPELVAETVADVCSKVGVKIGIHCHNDCGVALANTLAAVDAGVSHVQGTINGFGERCGNADLIQVIAALALKKNNAYELLRPDSPTHLTDLSRFVYEMLNVQIPSNSPYVGRSAFAHKGGMHVSGIARNKTAYEHIVPESVGNERRILVSELSGRSNIVALTQKFNQPIAPELTQKILDEVVARENDGYQYEVADGSFELLVKRCTNTFKPHFERINYHLIVQSDEHGVWETSAAIKIRIGDIIRHDVAEGDGPVNALDAALRKALLPSYPQLSDMKLVDYKVRVINSEAATAAGVRVVIESSDSKSQWGTVGVSTNIVEASWLALVDSIEFKLNRT